VRQLERIADPRHQHAETGIYLIDGENRPAPAGAPPAVPDNDRNDALRHPPPLGEHFVFFVWAAAGSFLGAVTGKGRLTASLIEDER